MTSMQIVIEGNVDEKLGRLFEVLQPGAIESWLGEVLDTQLHNRVKNRFAKEGDDAVGRWAPLTLATQMIRANAQFGAAHPINVRTGELKSFVEDSPGRVELDTLGATLTLPGSQPGGELGKKFAGAQQGEGTAPPRPVLGMNSKDTIAAMTALELYIRTGVGEL